MYQLIPYNVNSINLFPCLLSLPFYQNPCPSIWLTVINVMKCSFGHLFPHNIPSWTVNPSLHLRFCWIVDGAYKNPSPLASLLFLCVAHLSCDCSFRIALKSDQYKIIGLCVHHNVIRHHNIISWPLEKLRKFHFYAIMFWYFTLVRTVQNKSTA